MRIQKIELQGFERFAHQPGILLEDLQNRNVFIGPNNSGKSSLFRFFYLISRAFKPFANRRDMLTAVNLEPLVSTLDRLFFGCDTSQKIVGNISFCALESDYRTRIQNLINGDSVKIGFELSFQSNTVVLEIVPYFFETTGAKNTWERAYIERPGVREYLLVNKTYGAGQSDQHMLQDIKTIVFDWIPRMKFFDPIRALDRTRVGEGMIDGSELIRQLYDIQQNGARTVEEDRLKKAIFDPLNSILESIGTTITDYLVKGSPQSGLSLQLRVNNWPLPIESMGSGIGEIFMTCCWLALGENKPSMYFLEEPETHLHPALLRRYIQFLASYKNLQLFINSHSNALLNCLTEEDRLWRMERNRKGECTSVACRDFSSQHDILDALGINGGSLVQSNCAIWIEGPSDRAYLRKWLDQYSKERESLIENADYSFVIYGGKILKHFCIGDNITELISMLKVSRFSAVVMDKDLASRTPLTKLRADKKAILEDAEKDKKHRLAILTSGREIENDIPFEIFRETASSILGHKSMNSSPLKALTPAHLPGGASFTTEIPKFLGLETEETKSAKTKLGDKVGFAATALKICEIKYSGDFKSSNGDYPAYIPKLYEFIIRSRADEAIPDPDSTHSLD